jgi:hypothetical protein
MGNVDNIDVINLFDNQTSDHVINKCDHDYEKNTYKMITVKSEGDEEQDNVMELNNEIPPPANIDPTVQTVVYFLVIRLFFIAFLVARLVINIQFSLWLVKAYYFNIASYEIIIMNLGISK